MWIHAILTPIVCVDNILETNVGLVKACDKKAKTVASGLIDARKTRLEDDGTAWEDFTHAALACNGASRSDHDAGDHAGDLACSQGNRREV